jgi:CheY-like chemotaxis protein
MIPTLPSSINGFSSPGFVRITSNNNLNYEAQLTRTIQSFYLLAKVVVSKVSGMEIKKRSILIVDDEPLTFRLIDEFLKDANLNFEMTTSLNGKQAYEIATSILPDLIITDWLLPEVDGLELIRKLKLNPVTRDIPIIMITGVIATNEEFKTILQAGALDYIQKPLDYSVLSAKVKAAFALVDSLGHPTSQRSPTEV